jgi:hypothetical protein
MTMNESRPSQLSRRHMLVAAGGTGALAASAALLPAIPAIAPIAADAKVSPGNGGYQLTQHVRRYYQTTRI